MVLYQAEKARKPENVLQMLILEFVYTHIFSSQTKALEVVFSFGTQTPGSHGGSKKIILSQTKMQNISWGHASEEIEIHME